jgi:AcrR family transcriptional regulator
MSLLFREDELAVVEHVELARQTRPDRRLEPLASQLGRETRGPPVVAASDGAIANFDAHRVGAYTGYDRSLVTVAPAARERILESAYELFSTRRVRAVGVEEVIERADVAKATLYRHFPSKDDLVLAFLRRREEVWTHGWVETEARRRGSSPEQRLLSIFDLFDEWFHRADFEGCSFINVMLETASLDHPIGRASADHLENIRGVLGQLAEEAGLRDPDEFAKSFHIRMKGSIVQAGEGDVEAAARAKEMARSLIEKYR